MTTVPSDGAALGNWVRNRVGEPVFVPVSASDNQSIGLDDGRDVGSGVGFKLGSLVSVGILEGPRDGLVVGSGVGLKVGCE